jgi:hypothetical protein
MYYVPPQNFLQVASLNLVSILSCFGEYRLGTEHDSFIRYFHLGNQSPNHKSLRKKQEDFVRDHYSICLQYHQRLRKMEGIALGSVTSSFERVSIGENKDANSNPGTIQDKTGTMNPWTGSEYSSNYHEILKKRKLLPGN